MQHRSERENDELRAVLLAYLEACEQEPKPGLAMWIREYPEYHEDLIRLAVYHHTVERTSLTDEEERKLASTTFDLEQEVLDRAFADLPEPTPLESIVARVGELELVPESLGVQLNLTADIILKLERRILAPDSIPDVLVDRMATVLYCGKSQLRTFLSKPPAQPMGAWYHAERSPEGATQQTFAEAVRASRMMTAEQKRLWLEVAASGDDLGD